MLSARTRSLLLRLPAALAAFFLLASPCPGQQSQVGNVIGEVRVSRQGLPTKQLLVNLQIHGANINSVYTDSQGHFGFYSLPGGPYTINIQDDDYKPVSQDAVLDLTISVMVRVNVTLEPRDDKKPADTSLAGSNPAEINVKDLSREFPKKAIQEYEKGVKANNDGDSLSATRHFQKSVELAPGFYPAHNELGRGFLAKSDFPSAQHEFEEVIRANQTDGEAYINLGNVYLLTNHLDEALAHVQEGLRRNPRSAVGQFILGSIDQKMHKPDESERALREALRLDPKMYKVHLALFNVYLSENDKPEAVAELKDFLKAAPADPLSAKCREILRQLESSETAPQ
jgi:tetratricopeptide (TPR) repeat protein